MGRDGSEVPPDAVSPTIPTRGDLIVALIDRARYDRAFWVNLQHDPVAAAATMDVTLSDAEWAGLRDLLSV
jgi:hypothetical protein